MAKRFTATEIWEEDWFIDLPNKYKLLWNYVKDKCDNVGIWRPNVSVLQKIIGESLNLKEFILLVNEQKERIKELPSGRWWLKDFFVFQYGNVFSPTSPVHKGALKQLVSNGIHPNEILGLDSGKLHVIDFEEVKTIAYDKSNEKIKEAFGIPMHRDKDKDKDKDKYKGGAGGKINGSIKGVSFDETLNFVNLSDGTIQELGIDQRELAKSGRIKPHSIIKGSIN